MQHRTLSIVIGTLCLGAAAGIAFFSQDSLAVERPPGGRMLVDPAPTLTETTPTPEGVASDAVFTPTKIGPVSVAAASDRHTRTDTSGWTTGIICGDIQLAVSVLDQLGSITVVVEEARSAFDHGDHFQRPHRMLVPAKRDLGTPTFEVRDVPFSEYPYTVTVHAAGLNGSQRTVVINQDNPLVDDVLLSITPGAPYSILLRDQDARPHAHVAVNMTPVGQPHGRPRQAGTTDNFGSVVFDRVLAGNYQLSASIDGQPLGQPEQVTVQPGVRAFNQRIQGQGHTMRIPRGVPLKLLVHDAVGYGIPEATVTATAADRVRLTKQETTTDAIGRASFAHLQPGVWHIVIEHEKCQRVDLQMTLKADQQPEQRNVKLVRNRRY